MNTGPNLNIWTEHQTLTTFRNFGRAGTSPAQEYIFPDMRFIFESLCSEGDGRFFSPKQKYIIEASGDHPINLLRIFFDQ